MVIVQRALIDQKSPLGAKIAFKLLYIKELVYMNSQERHEARYQRRVQKRKAKRDAKISRLGGYDNIFSYEKLYEAFYLCEKEVRWKGSVQTYEATLLLTTLKIYNIMKNRKFKPMGFLEFNLCERGKLRHIRALKIDERCIQRTLCDNYLSPLLEPQLIYDNGASIKNKGIDFSINRMKRFLLKYYRKYHTNEGYIFQYDFSSYFDNINHDILLELLEPLIPDKEIFQVLEQMIRCFGDKGLGLGSQVSQIAAIFYPTVLDRYFKEVLKMEGYCRYMDDGAIICHTLEEAEECRKALYNICDKLDIKINPKKISISKLSNTFIFLKKRIKLTETGGVIIRVARSVAIRARRRLKKLARKAYDAKEKFSFADLNQCYKSWLGSISKYQNYFIAQNYRKLYFSLISKYNLQEQVKRRKRICWMSMHMVELLQI